MRKLSLILFIAVIFLSIFTIPGLTDNTSLDNKSLVDLSLKIQSLQKLNKAEKSKLQKKLLTYIYEDNVELKHILKELDNVKNEDYNAIINTFADSYKKKPVKNTSPDQNNVFNGEKEYTEKNIEGDIKGDLVIKKGENIIIKDESLKIDGKIVVETDASLKLVGNEIELNGNLNVRPYGNLLLDNTSLSIIHKYKGHREINTDKGSTIKIKDSTIKTKDSPGSGDWLHSNFEIRSNDNKLFQVIGSKIYAD